MTDKEIIQALEYCKTDKDRNCRNCPYKDVKTYCFEMVREDALDLINRQQAEIERLQENNKAIMQTIADVHTEAIKEFDERLKEDCLSYPLENGDLTMLVDVESYNNLKKETVGEQE